MVGQCVRQQLKFAGCFAVLTLSPWLASPLSPRSERWLLLLLLGQALVWMGSGGLRHVMRSPIAFALWAVVLVQGWWMVLNAHGLYFLDATGPHLVALDALRPAVAGAMDHRSALWMMCWVSGLAALFGCVLDLSRDAKWRRWIIGTIIVTGALLTVEGFAERLGRLHLYASRRLANEGLAFASFNYHANAGAFIPARYEVAEGRPPKC